uniref:Uncharacterized protein n=1 Tax=Anguilla anguilla TaxID=7936 RepID=A0A0E9REG0_ANGAN
MYASSCCYREHKALFKFICLSAKKNFYLLQTWITVWGVGGLVKE